MMPNNIYPLLSQNFYLIIISFIGGVLLAGLKFWEHLSRKEEDKLPLKNYCFFLFFLLFILPLLGSLMTSIYIINGDKLSTILALQIGLSSPAIIQSLLVNTANILSARQPEPIGSDQ